MKRFNQVMELHGDKLELYVPVVARVHGGSHPEFHSVRQVYDQMISKIEAAGTERVQLDAEFAELRKITDSYSVPDDVCESYAAVYEMLAELDRAYFG